MAADTFESLGFTMYRQAAAIPNLVQAVVVSVALLVDEEVIRDTPVDTGLARSNWRGSINGPVDGVIYPYDFGDHLGINETGNANGAISQARREFQNSQPGDVIYVQNNVDYIGELDRGSSTQAPVGFVDKAIRRGIEGLRNVKLIVK